MIFQDYVSLSRSLSRKVMEQDYVSVIQQDQDYVYVSVLDYSALYAHSATPIF